MTDHETEEELVKRFLRYVKVPSQSEANGGVKVPSTESQWDMAHLLQEALNALGMDISPRICPQARRTVPPSGSARIWIRSTSRSAPS